MYYRVIPQQAGECLRQLHKLKRVHTYFAGYLAMVQEAHRLHRLDGLGYPFQHFFEHYLQVAGGPSTHPFVRLFLGDVKGVVEASRFWQGANIAGTYAPSGRESLKQMFPITLGKLGPEEELLPGTKKLFGLHANHAARVLQEWCGNSPVPIYPLALFLLRDTAIELSEPTTAAWVTRFQEEFGYRDAAGNVSADYYTLFSEADEANYQPADAWLMPYISPTTS